MKTYINGHCIEQVLTNAVELTTAQYNALSSEQKNHGTYIITDAEAPNISATQVEYSTGISVKDDLDDIHKHWIFGSDRVEDNVEFGVFTISFTYNDTTYTDVIITGYKYSFYVSCATPPEYRYSYVGQVLAGSVLPGATIFYNGWNGEVNVIGQNNGYPLAHNALKLFSTVTKDSSHQGGTYNKFVPNLVVVKIDNYYDSTWLSNPNDLNKFVNFTLNETNYNVYFNNGGQFDCQYLPDGAIVNIYTLV